MLPPGEWDPNIRIEPPDAVPSQGSRLMSAAGGGDGNGDEEHDPAGDREEALRRTGRSVACSSLVSSLPSGLPLSVVL